MMFSKKLFGGDDFIFQVLVAQLCPTLCDPMDCCLPGSSVNGILQVRVLEWGAIAFSIVQAWELPKRLWHICRLASNFLALDVQIWACKKLNQAGK